MNALLQFENLFLNLSVKLITFFIFKLQTYAITPSNNESNPTNKRIPKSF
jgi:hypothetical protein